MGEMGKSISVTLPGPTSQKSRLPLLVEISLTATPVFIIVVASVTAILSIIAGADVLTIIVRTAAAILGIGIPAFLLNWLVGRYFVEATIDEWMNLISKDVTAAPSENQSGELEAKA